MRTRAQLAAFLKPREKQVQRGCYSLVEAVGGKVWNLSQARATRQSAGLPDAFLGYRGRLCAFECKRPGGTLTPAQLDFRAWCRSSGLDHVAGGLEEVRSWLDAVRARSVVSHGPET